MTQGDGCSSLFNPSHKIEEFTVYACGPICSRSHIDSGGRRDAKLGSSPSDPQIEAR